MKISELPIQNFTSSDIDNCFYVEDMNKPTMKAVKMQDVFNWIKGEASKNGLTVKLENERIMFISGSKHECKYYVNADWGYLSCECGKRIVPEK